MRSNRFQVKTFLVASLMIILASLSAAGQESRSDEQKYAGTWVGSYVTKNGESNKLSFILSRDEKGAWRGTIKFTNQDGEQTADFKELQVADGKIKGKLEDPGGQVEVTLEGQFKGDSLEGNYTVFPKGSTDAAETGTWKLTKGAAAKSGM